MGYDRAMVERVDRMVAGAEFKRQVPPIAKLGPRTAGVDYLYPAPPARLRRAPERWPAGTLYVVATPIGNLGDVTLPRARGPAGRAADRGRGHPGHAPAARPLRDPDPDGELPRAERPGPRARAARPPRGRRGPRARDRRRHAGRVRPRRGPRRGLGGGGRHGRARSRARRRCWPRSPRRASPGRAGRSRGSCRGPGGSGGSGWRAIAADERGAILFEAPTRLAATLRDLAAACGDDRPGAVCRELTKLHEQVVRGPLGDARGAGGRRHDPGPRRARRRGRVGRAASGRRTEAAAAADDALVAARAEVERLVADGVPRGEAAKRVAAATGIPRRALYGEPAGR